MSNSINKSDFYYGAFLAKVIENENNPALVNKDNGRGIHKLGTEKEEYIVYIKYATNNNKDKRRWNFYYTDNNIEEIEKYIDKGYNIIFAYICAYEDLRNGEIAIARLEEFKKCIVPRCTVNKDNRVTIYKMPN